MIYSNPYRSEYGMLALKLRLNEEKPIDATTGREHEGNTYTIGMALPVCEPLNA